MIDIKDVVEATEYETRLRFGGNAPFERAVAVAIEVVIGMFNKELEEIRSRLPDPGYRCVVEREDGL